MDNSVSDDFRGAMRRLTTTVSVITSAQDKEWFGMTATAVTSVCAEPAALLVCISSASSLKSPLLSSGMFCINMLNFDQQHISTAFAGRLKGVERFSEGNWQQSEEGLPYLAGAQASIFCALEKTIAFGTHNIFIGSVKRVLMTERISPLLYEDGRYVKSIAM